MSKRKQAAIEAAKQAEAEQKAEVEGTSKTSFLQRLKSPTLLAAIGVVALLALGVVGATVGNKSNTSWLAGLTNNSSQSIAANPTPTPTPQLSKEYIYAGSRMLAVEDANAPASSHQAHDLVVWRLVNGSGEWYIRDWKSGQFRSGVWGAAGDIPKPADFDGDGNYDFCVFRPSNATWYIQPDNGSPYYSVQFGVSTDQPAPADYDGDGRADVAVYRDTTTGNPPIPPSFFILNSSTNTLSIVNIGQTGDKAVPADYDGDGRADAAVFRSDANWYIRQSTNNQLRQVGYGDPVCNDKPVPGDYDGDGKFDIAVWRDPAATNAPCTPPVEKWHVLMSTTNQTVSLAISTQSTDKPVPGDYDGDGKTDAAVWRPSNGTWYIRRSSKEGQPDQMRVEQWGQAGDTPVPAPFKR